MIRPYDVELAAKLCEDLDGTLQRMEKQASNIEVFDAIGIWFYAWMTRKCRDFLAAVQERKGIIHK